jgi:hypothetical protein
MIHSYLPWHHPIEWRSRPWLQDVDRAVTYTDAATRLLDRATAVLTTYEIEAGMRKVLGRLTDLKMLDSVLNIGWNVDQMHRLARGREPDLDRGALAASMAMIRRNGRVSLRLKRGIK